MALDATRRRYWRENADHVQALASLLQRWRTTHEVAAARKITVQRTAHMLCRMKNAGLLDYDKVEVVSMWRLK